MILNNITITVAPHLAHKVNRILDT